MAMRVVDLTLSSDDDDEPRRKRPRLGGPPPRHPAPVVAEDSDVMVVEPGSANDVEVLGPPARGVVTQAGPDLGDDDELLITGATGQVATRDLPHPRPDCADHRFTAATTAANAEYCPQCFCYVCDVKASECRFWGTGARERDHANARSLGYWRRLREAARAGNRAFVQSEYHKSGPLGTGVPPPQQRNLTSMGFTRTGAAGAPVDADTRTPAPASARAAAGAAAPSGSGAAAAAAGAAAAGGPSGSLGGARMAAAGPGRADDGELQRPGQPDDGGRQAAVADARPAHVAASAAGTATATGAAAAADTAVAAGTAARPSMTPDNAAAAATSVKQQQSNVARLPYGTCRRKPLPDPSCDAHAFELGVLRFNVKAASDLRIVDIAPRVPRFGFYHSSGAMPDDFGDQLPLERLFESKYGNYGGKYKSKAQYLKLLPLPAPPEEAVPVPTQRLRKVLVVDCLGRSRATYVGVQLDVRAKRADLLAALAPLLRPAFSPAAEILHLATNSSLANANLHCVEPERNLDDAFFTSYACSSVDSSQVIVFRTAHHPAPSWEASGSAAGSGSNWAAQMPVYSHAAADGTPASSSMYMGMPVSKPPSWVAVTLRQLGPQPTDSWTPNTNLLSAPVLVPLRKEHIKGGKDAEKQLNAALLRAMQPYRTNQPLTASSAAPMLVLRGHRSRVPENPSLAQSRDRWSHAGEQLSVMSHSFSHLTAVWPREMPPASYRLDEMRTPAVDPSARPEAFKESEANIKEAKRRLANLGKRKTLTSECISELTSAALRPHPEDKATIATMTNRGGTCDALVALETELRPSSRPGASPREGELVIKVYCWMSRLAFRAPLFKAWDDWSSIAKTDTGRFPLTATMELLATGVTDATEQRLMAAAGGGPSTSRPAELSSLPLLRRRVHAERQRAREMVARVKELGDNPAMDRGRSINHLLEFMQSGERPAAPQPDGLTVAMRPYQLQSLAFMLEMERLVDAPPADGSAAGPSTSASASASTSGAVDPADPNAPDGGNPGGFRRLLWVPVTNPNTGQRYWYSPVLKRVSLQVPPQSTGGFLAEEMGLGKTVEVMALTLANPAPPSLVAGSSAPCGRIVSRATLVVCAVSLVGQWQAEAQNKTTGACRIHPYHGQSRIRDPGRLATEFDVVVTTYQTLQSDHASGKGPCGSILWHRIVFDEGHTLRSAAAKLFKAAVELASPRRWLCTGTPINNAVDDLLGQFGAIHLMPLGKKTFFDSYVKLPFNGPSHRHYGLSMLPLLYTLRHALIRHTKAQNLGGEGVLQLPPKTEESVAVLLSEEEQAVYRRVHKEAARGWQKLKAVGPSYVNSHLFTATSMLMPLRRICSGGHLQPRDLTVPDPERLVGVAAGPGGSGAAPAGGPGPDVALPADVSECPICVDSMEEPVVTPCNHWFCKECITGWIHASAHHNCPTCRQPVALSALRRGITAAPAEAAAEGEDVPDGCVACESKLACLLEELRAMREADPTAKALVFTQFGQSLEWLKPRLEDEGFGYRSITGDMTQKRRTEAIASFERDPSTVVFLLSVRSGAVGINLTAANHVFLLEPCINPAMEEQAIGRAWRMGQQRPVVVKRLYVKGSIEERIMEIVKARRAAGGAGSGPSAGGAGPSGSAGPAGSLRQDKSELRITELDLMFGEPQFPQPEGAAGGAGSG